MPVQTVNINNVDVNNDGVGDNTTIKVETVRNPETQKSETKCTLYVDHNRDGSLEVNGDTFNVVRENASVLYTKYVANTYTFNVMFSDGFEREYSLPKLTQAVTRDREIAENSGLLEELKHETSLSGSFTNSALSETLKNGGIGSLIGAKGTDMSSGSLWYLPKENEKE